MLLNIGKNVKHLRMRHGLTQKQLAQKLNKSESAIRMWELGKAFPDLDSLLLIANMFEVTTDWLLSNDEVGEEPLIGRDMRHIISKLPELSSNQLKLINGLMSEMRQTKDT